MEGDGERRDRTEKPDIELKHPFVEEGALRPKIQTSIQSLNDLKRIAKRLNETIINMFRG